MDAKRIFDILASGIGLVLLAPVLALIMLLIPLDSAGSPFFTQDRVGRRGVIFKIYKFRTMAKSSERDLSEITVGMDPRITKFGASLRKWKLDELPQLWNVLRGQMSLVGPRPEVPKYVAHYPADLRHLVLSVRPGITDPCSLRLGNESELLGKARDPHKFYIEQLLPKKLEIYSKYVNNQSLYSDILIIFETILIVFQQKYKEI
jgi:lipopolysaccharide/colanic/teichoic acid biosynthesis glycosyltransferase